LSISLPQFDRISLCQIGAQQIEMLFDRLLLRQQVIQSAVKPVALHLLGRDLQQIFQRRFGIKVPLDVKLAGGMTEAPDGENGGGRAPRPLFLLHQYLRRRRRPQRHHRFA
jgi:hypothetical protein